MDNRANLTLEQLLHRMGGVAGRAALIEVTSRSEVDRALREQRIMRLGRGRYALPTAREARRAAATLAGVVSHRSAAAAHGWEMKTMPEKPVVTVARNRRIDEERRQDVDVRWSDLRPTDVVAGWVTSPARTIVDCCRELPFDEALAIADSALRVRSLTKAQLLEIAGTVRGPGSRICRKVAREADGRADNPFESVLRAISLEVHGLRLLPQLLVLSRPFTVRPDLVDERLRLAVEADSFTWHGNRGAHGRDCRRYNLLSVHGWCVLRFTWEDVMLHPSYVRATLAAALVVHRHAQRGRMGHKAA